MRSFVASAILTGAVVLAPVMGGYAPALSQDFSITNQQAAGTEWIRKLQAWWDVHAYYPPDALAKNESGTVKVHLTIHPDGEVWTDELVEGSGSRSLDQAGLYAFHGAHLPPFPPGTPTPQAEVNLTLHFVLAHRPPNSAFTMGNDPVEGTVVDTYLERSCSGYTKALWSWQQTKYDHIWIQTTWYRRPDGTKWVKFYYNGTGPILLPVTELGKSAQFTTPPQGFEATYAYFAVWPNGANSLSGTYTYGTIDLACD